MLGVPGLADGLAAWMETAGLYGAGLVADSFGCQGTHPFIRSNGEARASDRYRGVVGADLLGEPLPAPRTPAAEMVFGRALVRLRRFVADQAARIARDRLDRRTLMDVVLAVEELGANSGAHLA